jgi:hypothetical protein
VQAIFSQEYLLVFQGKMGKHSGKRTADWHIGGF